MGSKKNVDMSQTEAEVKEIKIVASETVEADSATAEAGTQAPKAKAKSKQGRGKKYHAVRAQLDKTKLYEPADAVALVKKLSYSKFGGSVEAHLVVKEVGTSVDLSLPYSTGKSVKVAIATDALLAEVAEGKIDFDVLLASPDFMPKLAKLARILGPKGLMPNPKNGTLTPKPEIKKKELEAGAFTLKTEKKAPLMHLVIGKVAMDDSELTANVLAILKALKGKVLKMSLAASMSPGVKVNCELEKV